MLVEWQRSSFIGCFTCRWIAVASVLLAALGTASGQPTSNITLKSNVTNVQPMTGIVYWSDNPNAAKQPDAITLEYRYCGYNEVVQPDGEYDFSKLDAILDEIAGRNHQAVLRFYFCYVGKETTVPDGIRNLDDYRETVGKSEGKTTHFCDWSHPALQQFALDFYTRFAERYDRDPRIAFLQTGFGLWAEYHIYDGPRQIGQTFPSRSFQSRFLHHLGQQFQELPWSISIDAADNEYSPLEDNRELLGLPFGVFDDSFLCKPHAKENAVNWKTLGADRWRRQPGGGEFSYFRNRDQKRALSDDGPNGRSFADAAKQFHITYMIGNDQPQYQPVERIISAGLATGYRFRVINATLDGSDLRLEITNDGVAPIYRDAYFAAGTIRSDASLRGLLPGEKLTCVIRNVASDDVEQITIQCDAILPSQTIQFDADL